ncbi:MAG TPA: alpha/beta hydrolase [Euzebya sp.]|nr:alpha/beta hydrolase [Euzebya sp.]
MLTIDIDGPVHYTDTGGPADAPVAVLVHGLGASHLSWQPFEPLLAATHRVIAVDLVGFGHTEPAGRGTTVADNRDHLARFIREVVDGPVTLMGNSMGGMVGVLLAHAHPTLVEAMVLLCPALPSTLNPGSLRRMDPQMAMYFALYNTPVLGERFLRRRRSRTTPAQQVHELLEIICTDADRVPRETVDLLVAMAAARRQYAWADRAFLTAERSLMRQLTLGRQRYLAAIDGLGIPTLLVHGEDDRLVAVSAAIAVAPRNPHIELVTMPGVGHAPQLEVPEDLSVILNRWRAGSRMDVA